jgi:hypothetical protein
VTSDLVQHKELLNLTGLGLHMSYRETIFSFCTFTRISTIVNKGDNRDKCRKVKYSIWCFIHYMSDKDSCLFTDVKCVYLRVLFNVNARHKITKNKT